MAVTRYSLVAHDWLNLEYIINDLTRRIVTQEIGPTSTPTFEDVLITGLSGSIISSESVETSIEELDTAIAALGDGSQYLLLDGTRAMEGDLDMDGNNIDNCGTVDASSGKILTTDGGTSAPSSESDGYIGVTEISDDGRVYFFSEGRRYYLRGVRSLQGTPIGLGLLFTHPADRYLNETFNSLDIVGSTDYGIDLSSGTWTNANINLSTNPIIQHGGTQLLKADDVNYNFFLGSDVFQNDNGQYNVGIGYKVGYYNDTTGGGDFGDQNVYIGSQAGYGVVTGSTAYGNTSLGYRSLYAITSGYQNVAVGFQAGYHLTWGTSNMFLGANAGFSITTGLRNVAVGNGTLFTGNSFDSVAIGASALQGANGGYYNTAVGSRSGKNVSTGDYNVFLGYYSGYNQTTNSNLLIIDNQDRGSVANEAANSLLYGLFDAVASNQYLKINGSLYLNADNRKIYLGTGNDAEFYYDGTDVILQCRAVGTGSLRLAGNLYPNTDDTYYIGKNDDDSALAWKGIILKDQTTGTYYRVQLDNGAWNIVDLTD
jgi:hypothetical protein